MNTGLWEPFRSVGTNFRNNVEIDSFNEFEYFLGLELRQESDYIGVPMQNAFSGSSLREISMPPLPIFYNASTGVGSRSPFYNCTKLSKVYWGSCRPVYTHNLFEGCSALEYYDGILPAGLTIFGGGFSNCRSLTRMIFYEGIESFGGSCFQGCSSLRYIEYPATSKSISLYNLTRWAFSGGIHIVIKATTPPTCTTGGQNASMFFYVPDESVEVYKAAEGWSIYAHRIYPISELPDEYRAMGTL